MIARALSEDCELDSIPLETIRNLMIHGFPVYSNIAVVSDPTELEREIHLATTELNNILIDALKDAEIEEETKNEMLELLEEYPCVSIEDDEIVFNEICTQPLEKLANYMLDQYKQLMKKPLVSYTGSVISLVANSAAFNTAISTLCI